MAKPTAQKKPNSNDSGLNFEAQLWAAADKIRGHMDASGGMFVQSEKFVGEHGGRVATSQFTGRNGRKSIQRLAMKESRTLAALLPKLLSGELRVPLKS